MKKVLAGIAKGLALLVLAVIAVAAVMSVSPIYRFSAPEPFDGPDIFNPYENLDRTAGWKRANFHTHTKVDGIFNECDFTAAQTDSCLRRFGCDIVTFSNHNELTEHPYDTSLQVNVYEHGYNLFKYHKLVFGCDEVWRFDHLLPFLASQRQFQLDRLGRKSEFIQLNHPFRTNFTTRDVMEKLTGYRITELDSGVTTEQDYWDWSLSAGHYTFALANDDLHHPDRSDCIAVRCNFLNSLSARYEDIRETLLSGRYYCMRIPDYGNGDWETKAAGNADLPGIDDIGMRGDTIFLHLDRPAAYVRVYGQGHTVLDESAEIRDYEYVFAPEDRYARLTAYFVDGAVIYTNPFARFDSSVSETPYVCARHETDIVLTLVFNLLLVLAVAACVALGRRICR